MLNNLANGAVISLIRLLMIFPLSSGHLHLDAQDLRGVQIGSHRSSQQVPLGNINNW